MLVLARRLLACNPQSGHRCTCLTTGKFISTYLGTGIYAVYTTASASEDSHDHGIYITYTMATRDSPDIYAHALGLGYIYVRQIPRGHGITITYISIYTRTIYRDHEGLGILARNYHPKTSLIFVFWDFGSIG